MIVTILSELLLIIIVIYLKEDGCTNRESVVGTKLTVIRIQNGFFSMWTVKLFKHTSAIAS